MKHYVVGLIIAILLSVSCAATPTPSTPYPAQTFDFSNFSEFVFETGSISMYGYNPKPGIEQAQIHRTSDDRLLFSITHYLEIKEEVCDSERIYCRDNILHQRLDYPERMLTKAEQTRVEDVFRHIERKEWNEMKKISCDPSHFFVYIWDDNKFTNVFCWKNELTQETQHNIYNLLESLTQGEPSMQHAPNQ